MAVLIATLVAVASQGFASDVAPAVVNATPRLEAHVEEALGRFSALALPEPTLEAVVFDPDDEFCQRYVGRYTFTTRTALICFDADEMLLGSDEMLHPKEERVLLHEFAHAWTDQFTTAAERQAFMALHGVASWNGQDDRWHERGIEIAADTFAWVLSGRDEPPRHLASIDPAVLLDGFEVLTGIRV